MKLILYSGSIKSLQREKCTTSSENFQLSLIFNIAKYFEEIYIVSKSATNVQIEKSKKINLLPIENQKIMSQIKKVNETYNMFKPHETVVLFFGYDYKTQKMWEKISKKYNLKLVSFTFDTHEGSNSQRKGIKGFILNKYFELGIKKLNNLNGIILFNKNAYSELNLKIPFLVSKVGIEEREISETSYKRKNKVFKIVYAGSLEVYNGIELMISSITNNRLKDVELEIYGDGTLKEYVESYAKKYNNIKYNGIIERDKVGNVIEKADLLLNLRDINSVVSKYAFPSKLIEYMASGIPVLTTRLIDNKLFEQGVFILSEYKEDDLINLIEYIKDNPQKQEEKVSKAKEYLIEYNLWDTVALDVYEFMKQL